MLLWGWALAQWPYIIYPDLTIDASAAPTHARFPAGDRSIRRLAIDTVVVAVVRCVQGAQPGSRELERQSLKRSF